ncbi:hypothetical protein RN001_012571 [Aquatica leii]|uniref:Uncharacterized protein n=1 Tax=Aquatica leii TaxID=1421715 RepID=A0AAN7SF88_9COLE|nr:hypothetical protein RN001_012571 [Aquatica leii]
MDKQAKQLNKKRKKPLYPNINDVISTVMGPNAANLIKEFGERKSVCFKALVKQVETTKIKSEPVKPQYPRIAKQFHPHLDMFKLVSGLPTTPSTKNWNNAIWKKLSCRGLEKIYHNAFQELVKEVQTDFITATHYSGMICIINPPDESYVGHLEVPPYKQGKTANYEVFLRAKEKLESKLLITYPLLKQILKFCVMDLPECLFSLKSFRDRAYDVSELYVIFDKEIKKCKDVIRLWYREVAEHVRNDKSRFPKKIRYNIYSACTSLMATFLTLSICNTIEHVLKVTENEEETPFITMNMYYDKKIILQPSIAKLCHLYIYLIDKISSVGNGMPALEAYHCKNHANKLLPVYVNQELQAMYEKKIKYNIVMLFAPVNLYIKSINSEFAAVYAEREKWYTEVETDSENETDMPPRTLTIIEAERFSAVSTQLIEIKQAVASSFSGRQSIVPSEFSDLLKTSQDVTGYKPKKSIVAEKIRRESEMLKPYTYSFRSTSFARASKDVTISEDLLQLIDELDTETQKDLDPIQSDMSFDEGYAKVEIYRSYLDKLSIMVDMEHYLVGQLVQSSCRDAISNALNDMIQKVAGKLVMQHTWLNEDICEQFEIIKARALTIPQTTEELMEQGSYMAWAASEHLEELKERLELSISVIINLIEMTTLTKDHIELNSKTIQWMDDIKPIFEQNAAIFEERKSEFEERLQKAVTKLNNDIDDFLPLVDHLNFMDDAANSRAYIQQLSPLLAKVRDFDNLLLWINKEETAFKCALSHNPDLKEIKLHMYPFYKLVKLCFTLIRKTEVWLYGPFEFLNFSEAESFLDDMFKELVKLQKGYKNKIKQAITDNAMFQFKGSIDDLDLLGQPAPIKLCAKAIQIIKDFRPSLNMMSIMCNDAMLQRHWDDMSEQAGFDITPHAGTTIHKFMEMGILPEIDKYEVISNSAIKERQLLQLLQKMQSEWENVYFKTSAYKDTGLQILTALDDIQAILDDHIIKTLTMRGSVFVKPYAPQVQSWYERISRVNSTLDEWTKVQSQWMYLLPIFSSKDIVSQMPEEGQLFKEVDSTFRRYLGVILREPKVIDTCPQPGLLENMISCTAMLERINEGVTAYLERKRIYFPRFFFLSNDEMLEILSETKDPLRVQPHLRKCFEGINRLEFDKDLKIHAMYSEEKERVAFLEIIDTVAARGSVEKWLVQVETEMLAAVHDQTTMSWMAYPETERPEWVTQWPGQVVLAVSQIYWTLNVHAVLNASKKSVFQAFSDRLKLDLTDIVTLVRSTTITNLARITIKALIVIDVHAKDVTQSLLEQNVKNDSEFKWLAQLRYYWEERCMVRIINATVKYAYEYLGNSDRLVITPLTDRCYRTLVGAFYLHLNGAPEGPAGTGKTETTKDLAKALAVQCVVFNCSDGLDYKAMGKFFKGLAAAGAWVCFDEFNRIEVEVLSVVAQQILCIVLAVRAHAEKFVFEGTELRLNPACYVCITMNPGYAGRSELPDNLKVLFRTVAMMVPDYAMIGEISLYSYGFKDARKLSVKIVTTYRCCSEQLSSQNHYDYGMRAVKSVLSACGNNKRKYPHEDEDILLLRSILDVNLAKFLNHDVPLFEGIISDLFPGTVLPEIDYTIFVEAVTKSCVKRNLQIKECVITKIIQTLEMMIVRHGFMLVGEPFAGKTMTLKVLADTLTLLHHQGEPQLAVMYQFINPKSVTMGQLYGQFDPVSYEWFDGVVATCFRSFVMDPCPDRKWVIFDGPVDAVWIENMNTVLDDNKKLCLMSGEVMAMTNVMSMIFEVMDLSQASPATVSRCGMIYMEPSTLGWRPHVDSWLPTCYYEWTQGQEDYILHLFDWVVPPSLYFIRKQCRQLCSGGEINLVKNMMHIMEMLLTDACHEPTKKEDDLRFIRVWLQATFLTSMTWGLGSILDTPSREKFDAFVKSLWRGEDEDNPHPSILEKVEIQIPEIGLLIDYLYVYRGKGQWKYWPDIAKSMRVEEARNIQQALIPTVDTIKYMYMVEMHIRHQISILLVGPTGTGKSFYLQDLLMNKLNQEKYEPAFVTFTVKISANQTQDLIISKLQKRRRGHYGPPRGKLCIIFVDDLNMPVKEVYGAQPPIELLRQYFDHKNWYDNKDTSPIYLHDILITGAMGPPGGSRQDVYSRFLRHFSIFSINEFSDETMSKIFCNVLLLGWKNNGFPSDVISNVLQVVSATLDIYKAAAINLLPTPAKSHYVFNLRDFARIICGCAMLRKELVDTKTMFAKIWVHEVLRVMYDRLVDPVDKNWVYTKLRSSLKDFFRENFDQAFEHLKGDDGKVTEESLQKLMFGTYLDTEGTEDDLKYEEVTNLESFINVASTALDDYNATHKSKMDIVLFTYALEHLSKICRIMSMPSGSALLVGVSGSGRQSLTKLATTITGYTFFQPEISKNYGMNEWREDLKKVVKEAGGKGKQTVFLFTEGQIKEEGFLQDIDGLLNAGEVPNIFQIDEKQEIMELVRLAAQGGNRNLDISQLVIFAYFIKRTREKLHMILCFSPIGSSFRTRLRLYPSLVNCCTIDWFEDWPEDALERVAHNWMGDVNLDGKVKEAAIIACKYFHVSARKISAEFYQETNRKTYITSASYLELIKIFTNLSNSRQYELLKNKRRYVVGLEKLQFAAEQIGQMQIDLEAFQPELKLMSQKATEMMAQIATETVEVEKVSSVVKKDEEAANAQAAEAQALKSECEADLALAIPILEEAEDALNTLKPADITLVKSMKNPPAAVKLVMAGVCVIKNINPDKLPDPSGKPVFDYWGPSKRLLGDMNFLQSLKDYDKDHIKPEIMQKIRKEYLPHPDFKPAIVAKASSAAEGLCKWIIAMDMYDKVAKVVGPKKAKLEEAEREYAATMSILMAKKEQVAKLNQKLADLNQLLEEATAKKQDLQDRVNLCGDKLVRANQLIGGLGGEKTRWTAAANNLQLQYECVAGDILISCGMIAYLSPFTMQWRLYALADWLKFAQKMEIPASENYDFTATLGNEIKIQDWYIAGLPRDAFSTGNAIIQDNSKRWSLLIDPQSQANLWVKKMEKRNDIRVTKFSDGNYMKVVEFCIETGRPVLIENIREDLEAPLDPLLYKSTFKQAGTTVIALGDSVIPYHKNFKLYLTSKMRNPHYLPEVFNKVTIINFALTVTGLEDQLLGIVVAKERPDLQRKKEELIIESAENKTALANVEEMILRTLSESKGDILEDESAIRILDQSKTISIDINIKQVAARETEEKIELFRLDYKPVATHSASLYYCIADLPNIDPMYQYSLGWFINLYISSIDTAGKSRELDKRIYYLQENFTYNLYANICRSLFEKDKLMFSFLLCVKIMTSKNKIQEAEYNFLLTGGIDVDNPIPNPASQWLSNKSWNEICRVEKIPGFDGFRKSFVQNISNFKQMYDLVEPQNSPLPSPWDKSLSLFQKLLVIRMLRPDKITVSISKYVAEEMSTKFIIPPPFDIAKSYEDSSCVCPLVFILSAGTDPMSALQKFAEVKGFSDKLFCISLGQGQGPIAKALVEQGQEIGSWVCLQNCHLAVSWMVPLEKLWESLDFSNTHMNFRMWLTSYPSDKFPVSILQNGVKMTNEPPTGLQQNLLRSYINEPVKDETFYSGCPGRDLMFARLLYGIAFFHAVIQERRSFGPLGWNIPYGFNESDFDISVKQLRIFINEYPDDPYEGVCYLTGECNYGGRVTDDWDRRLIVTLLEDFLNPQVVKNLNYTFSSVASYYDIPKKHDHEIFIKHILSLPQFHPPEVYGLHSNAGITRDLQISNSLLNALILLQGEASGGGGNEDVFLSMVTTDILSKLPKNFDIEAAKNKFPVQYEESMNTVLVQEMERFTKLQNEIRNSLLTIQKAIKGLVVMTPALEMVQTALLLGRIPAAWAKVSYPSLKSLPNYIQDFADRINFLNTWFLKGKPKNFWLSGFFFTQAFLTGAKQNFARKYKIPIDQLTFDFFILKIASTDYAPDDGIYVYGLYTDGARWDLENSILVELYPKILYDYMPLIWLKPILVSEYVETGRYKCPLYKTSERRGILSTTGHSTNYVLPFLLTTKEKPSHWIKRSVALLCQLS